MIDFKINEVGDILLEDQPQTKSPLKIKFAIDSKPKLKINFRTKTRQHSRQDSKKLKVNFKISKDEETYKRVGIVKDNSELAQSIAIRLKTELNELQNFFNDFGSELSRMRHKDLISPKYNDKIREYVEYAIKDILSSNNVSVSVDRMIEDESNFGLETLKITIFDQNGNVIYLHTI